MELAVKPAGVRGSLEGEAQKWTKTRLMVESCSTMSVIRLADQSRADLAPLCPRSDSRRCPPIFISFLSWRAPQLFPFCHLRHSLKNQRIRLTAFFVCCGREMIHDDVNEAQRNLAWVLLRKENKARVRRYKYIVSVPTCMLECSAKHITTRAITPFNLPRPLMCADSLWCGAIHSAWRSFHTIGTLQEKKNINKFFSVCHTWRHHGSPHMKWLDHTSSACALLVLAGLPDPASAVALMNVSLIFLAASTTAATIPHPDTTWPHSTRQRLDASKC